MKPDQLVPIAKSVTPNVNMARPPRYSGQMKSHRLVYLRVLQGRIVASRVNRYWVVPGQPTR